jgi:acyl carrier protein
MKKPYDSNLERLQQAFRTTFGAGFATDMSTAKYGQGGWDSLQHMVLIVNLEDGFDVSIGIAQVAQIRSFQDAIKVLSSLGVSFQEQPSTAALAVEKG